MFDTLKAALKLIWSILNKKREYRLQFNKEKDGCWYVDFPHWPFSHDNLAMVSGADSMCELLADGDSFVEVSVVPAKKQEQHDGYIELKQTEHSLLGGSTYLVMYQPFVERFKHDTIWICPVTLFVLGRYPKFLYVKLYERPYMETFSTPSNGWNTRYLMRAIMMQEEITFKADHVEQYFHYFSPCDLQQVSPGNDAPQEVNPCINKAYVLDFSKIKKEVKDSVYIRDYVEEFIVYARVHQDTTYFVELKEDSEDFLYVYLFRPALYLKNIILPNSFHSPLSQIFKWDDVDACINDRIRPRRYHLSCPVCGKPSRELLWINFNSPKWTWKSLCGRKGPLSICPDCHRQIEFLCERLS